MKLKELQKEWDTFGKVNPKWAIYNKSGSNISIEEFFKTGEREIDNVRRYLLSRKVSVKKSMALDFGCGMGRLTQAFSKMFNKVYGVDISKSMIELANKYNKYPKKCKYILNDKDNLSVFRNNTFDFVYTNIVLQHMKPKYALAYIKEFLRILRPEGILLFQIPSRRLMSWQTLVEIIFPKFVVDFTKKKVQGAVMEMHTIRKEKILEFLEENNAKIVDITENKSAGKRFESFSYLVRK